MLKLFFPILLCFVLSCKNDFKKKVLYDLNLYSTIDTFYNDLDKLVGEKKIYKIESKRNRDIYYSKYTDTIGVSLSSNKYESADKSYSFYGIIVPITKGNYVEEIRVYFLPEIYESFDDFYDRFYTIKNAYFWAKWEEHKNPYLKIIDNLNKKYKKWTVQNSDCNGDMLDSRLPFTPRCARYNWFDDGVQIKYVQSWEEINYTQSLHIEYSLDSITLKNNQKVILELINANDKNKF